MITTVEVSARLLTVFADAPTTTSPDGPEFGKASPLGLVIVVVLLIATALLVRSMNKRLRRLPTTFRRDDVEEEQEVAVPDDTP